MKIKISALTDVGIERDNNEDAYIFCPDLAKQDWSCTESSSYIPLGEYGAVLVVADGMGGTNAGEVASSIATNVVSEFFSSDHVASVLVSHSLTIADFMVSCISNANEAINTHACENPDTLGMGTTIVVCWLLQDQAHIAWCGDSRCYIFNPHTGLKQLTKDHSLVQELVDKGEITEQEALSHPDSNVITRALGDIDTQPVADVVSVPIAAGDTLLLCSDGLCGYCTNSTIQKVLEQGQRDVTRCRDALLKCALDAGGYDNICIALASVIGDDEVPLSDPSPCRRFVAWLKKSIFR